MKKNVFLNQCQKFLIKRYGEQEGLKISEESFHRYDELCLENENEPKAMHIHTRERIYPGIATFDALVNSGKSREEASDFVQEYYAWRSGIMGKKINKFMKMPGFYKMAPKLCRTLTQKMFSEEAAFQAKQYPTPKHQVRFDMTQCPYANICNKYGCGEIVIAYCKADDICFGNMHEKVKFVRTKTLAKGDDCCDFSISL